MANDLLGQVLGSVLGNASQGRGGNDPFAGLGGSGPLGGLGGSNMSSGLSGGSGGLGDLLGGLLGGGRGSAGMRSSSGGQGAALVAMLLPLAMQWVQRNGGIGAVLDRFRQKGYSQQAASWVSTGDNQPLDARAVEEVIGEDELSRLSQQLGAPREEIAGGFAQILPEVVNQLTPRGDVPDDADERLSGGMGQLQELLRQFQGR
jgi:uncharacterized protein YidB (DUF937 family)